MKTKVIVTIVVLIALSLSSFWSYRAGLVASQEMNAMFLIPIVKKQYECMKSNDMKCVAVTNEVLISSTTAQVQALTDTGMSHSLGDEGEKFLVWSKTTQGSE